MSSLLLGLCIGLLPALIAVLLFTRKVNGESALLRERLAAEEASRRHFVFLSDKHEGSVALLTKELHRLEVENTLLRSRLPVGEAAAAAA